jgi:hypothetical protein
MKKFILSLSIALAVLFACTSYAQTLDKKSNETKAPSKELKQQNPQEKQERKQLTPAEKAKKSVDRIAELVKTLTPEQVKKLTDLHLTSYTQMDKDKVALKDDKVKLQESMKANNQKINDGIKSILTADQTKVYTEAKKAKRAENDAKKPADKAAPAKEGKAPKQGK